MNRTQSNYLVLQFLRWFALVCLFQCGSTTLQACWNELSKATRLSVKAVYSPPQMTPEGEAAGKLQYSFRWTTTEAREIEVFAKFFRELKAVPYVEAVEGLGGSVSTFRIDFTLDGHEKTVLISSAGLYCGTVRYRSTIKGRPVSYRLFRLLLDNRVPYEMVPYGANRK